MKNVRSDQSVRLEGLDYGYYIIDEVTQVDGSSMRQASLYGGHGKSDCQYFRKIGLSESRKKDPGDDPSQQITDPDEWNDIADDEIWADGSLSVYIQYPEHEWI